MLFFDISFIAPGPSNTQSPVTTNGATNAPNVRVGATCYEVNLQQSTTMSCTDTKGSAALTNAGWFHMPSFTPVTISTGESCKLMNGDFFALIWDGALGWSFWGKITRKLPCWGTKTLSKNMFRKKLHDFNKNFLRGT